MASFEFLAVILTGLGLIASITYYTSVLKNQNKTRQAQLFNAMGKDFSDYDSWLRNRELFYMEWDDYDDFEKKYGSDTNPVAYAQRYSAWTSINNIGIMMKRNLLDEKMVYESLGSSILMMWGKYKPIIIEQRARYMGPNFMEHAEYLADRMQSIQKSRGIQWEPPNSDIQYFSDK